MSSEQASEFQRLHELTKHFQISDEVLEAFGEPDKAPGCGIIVDRAERMAILQKWRAEQSKPKPMPTPVARIFQRLLGEKTVVPPRWETVRDGPRFIYTRLSPIVDVHVGIDPAGRVAIKLFPKGEDDAGHIQTNGG